MSVEPNPPFLTLRDVVYTYQDDTPIVNGVSWDLAAGQFSCLVGRSGCGKTTLLKCASGLLTPQSGIIAQQDGTPMRPGPQVGYMFQAPTLLNWTSVLDNVLLPVSLQRRPLASDHARAQDLLSRLGLADYAGRFPHALSGGQQSRVALARALILEPSLLLLDEPFAALDAITRGELQDDLIRECKARRTTVLFVTHDITEAVYVADRVGVMHRGQLVADVPIALPAPRTQSMRHGAAFNEYCSLIFESMVGAA